MSKKEDKKQALVDAIVKMYGDKCVVTRKQIETLYNRAPSNYKHFVCITVGEYHRVKRGKYFICKDMSQTTALKKAYIKQSKKIKELSEDPIKLAKAILASDKPKTNKNDTPIDDFVSFDDIQDIFSEQNDVNYLLKTIN